MTEQLPAHFHKDLEHAEVTSYDYHDPYHGLFAILDRDFLKNTFGVDYYDGSILHNRFAYKILRKEVHAIGNIFAFIAPMEVTTNLIDLEDSMNSDFIYSDLAINFIIELPNVDLFAGVCFQRLFNAQLGSTLCTNYLGESGFVDGDDILVKVGNENKKASVSIATNKNGATLIHTGINIVAGDKAPSFAYSTNLTPDAAVKFMREGVQTFYDMVADIFIATTKVI